MDIMQITLATLLAALVIIVGVIPFYKELRKIDPSRNGRKVNTKAGKIFIAILILIALMMAAKVKIDYNIVQSAKESSDTLQKSITLLNHKLGTLIFSRDSLITVINNYNIINKTTNVNYNGLKQRHLTDKIYESLIRNINKAADIALSTVSADKESQTLLTEIRRKLESEHYNVESINYGNAPNYDNLYDTVVTKPIGYGIYSKGKIDTDYFSITVYPVTNAN